MPRGLSSLGSAQVAVAPLPLSSLFLPVSLPFDSVADHMGVQLPFEVFPQVAGYL